MTTLHHFGLHVSISTPSAAGDIDLATTTNTTYKGNKPEGGRVLARGPNQQYKYVVPPKMDLSTKYSSDFSSRKKFTPPPKMASPAPTTIQMKMFNE